MTDRMLLETILQKISGMDSRITSMDSRMANMEADLGSVKSDLSRIQGTVAKIEIEHGRSLGALLDGHNLNAEKLDRIEKRVSKQEETMLRKVF